MTTRPAACGTTGGYRRHSRQGEKPCLACRTAKADYSRQYRAANRQALSDYQRGRRHGDEALQHYRSAVQTQSALCAICCTVGDGQGLALDHDHITGRFRGAICGPCNRGLGLFKDDPYRLRKAADYVLGAS